MAFLPAASTSCADNKMHERSSFDYLLTGCMITEVVTGSILEWPFLVDMAKTIFSV